MTRVASNSAVRGIARLLALITPLCIAAGAFMGWAVGGLTVAGRLLHAAVLAPTDPVLAGDV